MYVIDHELHPLNQYVSPSFKPDRLSQRKDRFISQMVCFPSARPQLHQLGLGPLLNNWRWGVVCVPFIHVFRGSEQEQAPRRPLEATWNSQNCFPPFGGGRAWDHQDSCGSKNVRRLQDPERIVDMDEVWKYILSEFIRFTFYIDCIKGKYSVAPEIIGCIEREHGRDRSHSWECS